MKIGYLVRDRFDIDDEEYLYEYLISLKKMNIIYTNLIFEQEYQLNLSLGIYTDIFGELKGSK